jgi:hypothetical protein
MMVIMSGRSTPRCVVAHSQVPAVVMVVVVLDVEAGRSWRSMKGVALGRGWLEMED